MKVNTVAIMISREPEQVDRADYLVGGRNLWKAGLLGAGILGVVFGLAGLLLSMETLIGVTDGAVSTVGTLLVALSFPLMFLAAHCMDKVREADLAIKLEYCRRHGLKDENPR